MRIGPTSTTSSRSEALVSVFEQPRQGSSIELNTNLQDHVSTIWTQGPVGVHGTISAFLLFHL